MDIKDLGFKQSRLIQKLFKYCCSINHHQEKTNGTENLLSLFLLKSQIEKKTLQTENSYILYQLHTSLKTTHLRDLITKLDFSNLYVVLIYITHLLLNCKNL